MENPLSNIGSGRIPPVLRMLLEFICVQVQYKSDMEMSEYCFFALFGQFKQIFAAIQNLILHIFTQLLCQRMWLSISLLLIANGAT